MTRRALLLAVAALWVAGGCETPTAKPAGKAPASRPAAAGAVSNLNYLLAADPVARRAEGPTAIHMDVFLLDVPAGAISGDEPFWRTVNEDAVGPAADQRLLANGIRCGTARRRDWQRFQRVFEQNMSRARQTKVDSFVTSTVPLDLDDPVDREDVFFLDADGRPQGRTYDQATNGITMTFGPTPRNPGSVRLTICPVVKRTRRRLEFTATNQPYEALASDVDRVYDAGLTADVATDEFLIVAPGPVALAEPDVSLGGRFLLRRESAALREQIIVAIPTLVPLRRADVGNAE